jgi:hypothetical protein
MTSEEEAGGPKILNKYFSYFLMKKFISDPGDKEAPDPESVFATLLHTLKFNNVKVIYILQVPADHVPVPVHCTCTGTTV